MPEFNPRCRAIFEASIPYLQIWAWYAQNSTAKKNIVFCILVDSQWGGFVTKVYPDYCWQKIRDEGKMPIAIGLTTWEEIDPYLEHVAKLREGKDLKLSPGMVRVLVLSDEGGSVGEIRPLAPTNHLYN